MKLQSILIGAAALLAAASAPQASACSRILYVGDTTATANDQLRIVGRSLDWATPIPTNIYVYPRGMHKLGNNIPGSIEWTSKYGAVYAVSYDGGITEGMNEKGLVINGLFCRGTVYDNEQTLKLPGMSLAMFVGWLLDMNATTAEVVEVLREHNFNISGATFDGGTVSALHWGITDPTGACAVLEFDHGDVKVYTGQDLPALTNDPDFPAMNAINDYWVKVGGENFLPGTVKSPDRYARGYFFQGHVEHTNDADLGLTIIRTILFNVSVPYKYTVSTEKNVSSTQWRSFANLRDRLYYFDLVTNRGIYYIDLKTLDLYPGAPVLKLVTTDYPDFAGCINSHLKQSNPFTPMY
ncbi:MAG: linear amide C-N hydrolase [Bacteroidales bacterium]|nr:linear amide C-N hydrolase [Bacteroidales bacterium]